MTDLLKKLSQYREVIGLKGSDYEGLRGSIEKVLVGSERQTENDCNADIIVNFREFEFEAIESSHPHLNGTSISEVIMGEDELGFFREDHIAVDIHGRIVCLECYSPLDHVTETQYDDISWSYDPDKGEYVKTQVGGSEGKKCPLCDAYIEDCDEIILSY